MTKSLLNLFFPLTLVLASCTSSIPQYQSDPIDKNTAIVFVINDSAGRWERAKHCHSPLLVCLEAYELGGPKGVMAYPVKVGTNFKLNYFTGGMGALQYLSPSARTLTLEKPGLYFYSKFVNLKGGFGEVSRPSTDDLVIIALKYKEKFKHFSPVNFVWPDETLLDHAIENMVTSYEVSPKNQAALKKHYGKKINLSFVAPPEVFKARCNKSTIVPADGLPVQEYIRLAFNEELKKASVHGEGRGITAKIENIEFSYRKSSWSLSVILDFEGTQTTENISWEFDTSWALGGQQRCAIIEDEFSNLVQRFVSAVISSEYFEKYVN